MALSLTLCSAASASAKVDPAIQTTPPSAPRERHLQAAGTAFQTGYAAAQRGDLPAAEAAFAKVVRLSPRVAAGHAAYGAVLLQLGKVQLAITELEKAHALDPQDPACLQDLGSAYAQDGKPAEARKAFEAYAHAGGQFTADASFRYAQALVALGLLDEANIQLTNAVDHFPDNALLADALGVVLARQQHPAEAEAQFRRAATLDPALAQAQLHLGTTLLLEQNPAEAVTALNAAVAAMPSSAEAHYELGRALNADGQDEAAIRTLQQALSEVQSSQDHAAPDETDVKYALALAFQNRSRNQEALPLLQQTVQRRPEDAAALINLGLTLVQLGKAREALPYYQRAERLNPNDWILQQDMGVAYLQQSDLDHAIERFQRALTLKPANAQLHYDLGLAYKLKDDLAHSIEALSKAEEEDPALAEPPYTLGVLFMQTGKLAEAQQQLQKATSLRPDNGDAWSVLGSVEKQLNDPQSAIRDLTQAIQLQPDQPGNHVTLAAVLAQQGKHDQAVAERKIAAELTRAAVNKQKAGFALDTGRTLLKQGHVQEAVTQLRRAAGADDSSAEIHLALAEALSQAGQPADAALERQKAASLAPK